MSLLKLQSNYVTTTASLTLFQRQDPTQFLQVHGRQTKIHIDPQIAALADDPKTM